MPDLACQKLLSGEWERHQRVSSEQWTQSNQNAILIILLRVNYYIYTLKLWL
jgi:hypothetical protein